MAKNKSKELKNSTKLVGIIVILFFAYGAFLYMAQEDVVPIVKKTTVQTTGTTPVPTVTEATPIHTASTTTVATPPPTPKVTTASPTPKVTEATPPPTPKSTAAVQPTQQGQVSSQGTTTSTTPSPTTEPAIFKIMNVVWSKCDYSSPDVPVYVASVGANVCFSASIQTITPGIVDPYRIGIIIKKDIVMQDDKALNPSTGKWDTIFMTDTSYEYSHAFRKAKTPFYLDGAKVIFVGLFTVDEPTGGSSIGDLREYFAKGIVYFTTGQAKTSYSPQNEGERNRVVTS